MLYKIISRIFLFVQNIRYNHYRRKYNIHPSFRFNGKDVFFYGDGDILIDEGSYIGSFSAIGVPFGCKVVIGKGCSISHNVRMYTSSKMPDYDFSEPSKIPVKTGDIIIGNYVWIGANVFITPGITIGENSVIGANSVVTKDIESHCIYGGVPAKLIRMKRYND